LLTGILTGIERWNGGGDTPFEDGRSGKPPSGTLGTEAERLGADGLANRIGVARIKTGNAQMEMIGHAGATPLKSQDLSLVAGDVTGGGGKATKQKT
jgi:hypothetical protein